MTITREELRKEIAGYPTYEDLRKELARFATEEELGALREETAQGFGDLRRYMENTLRGSQGLG